jgi:tRNA (guanine37-N1)-methyltransferase
MHFNIFTLHPDIFNSFFSTALIAKGLERGIFSYKTYNWRQEFGTGNYKQVDKKPFGGGTGMLLKAEPIFQALQKFDAVSKLFKKPEKPVIHSRKEPNNHNFFNLTKEGKIKKATILLSPRGFTFNQQIAHWLANNFQELNFVCGRYEGFDARVSEAVDLEISIGNFVLGGGEVASMAIIETITRLLPGFLIKQESRQHDSFSSHLNIYTEQMETILGKKRIQQKPSLTQKFEQEFDFSNLFCNSSWNKYILPKIEHPQYTRPVVWQNFKVPEVLLSGDHKKVQKWRESDWQKG